MTITSSSWLGRIREVRLQHGHWAAAQLLIDRFGKRVLGATITKIVRLEAHLLPAGLAAPPGFTMRFLAPAEVKSFAADPASDLGLEFACRAEAGHDLCFAALSGERLAGYGWYAMGSIEAEHGGGLAISYPATMAYMYKGFTHPDFRGQRLHGILMGLALQELAARGVEQLISTVDWTNWPSLKSCYRLGYKDLGWIVSLGPARRPFTWASAAPRRLGVEFGSRAHVAKRP